jgi:hypothetical protein
MTLYYNTDNYEIKDLSDELVSGWIENNNPKKDKWVVLPERPSNDHYWNNGQWVLSSPSVPESVSARQIRLWLINNGIQLIQVENAINSIEDPITRETVKVEWEYAPYVERNHPMLVPLAQALGLTEEQIDQAFVSAQNI